MLPLFDDDPRRCAARGTLARDLFPDASGHAAEDKRLRIEGIRHGNRGAAVGGFADFRIERHLAEKLCSEPVGLQAGAAMRKDLAAAAAMRAQEVAHILDYAKHWHMDLLKHVET